MQPTTMTTTSRRHWQACAMCEEPIHLPFLLCGRHWQMVPPERQLAVYRAWGALEKLDGTGKRARPPALQAYLAARDAAIETVRTALAGGDAHGTTSTTKELG